MTYLKHAGLIEAPARGRYWLTARGRSALAESGGSITLEYLARFPEYRAFIGGSSSRRRERAPAPAQAVPDAPAVDRRTPQDVLAEAVERLDEDLRGELLDEIMRRPPDFFERLVVDLLLRMGYGGALDDAGRVVGKAGDEGIDGIIQEDKLGFSRIYIQAKRWAPQASVGREEIQKFAGALAGQGADKGLFITTARFTREALAFPAKQHAARIVLVDGRQLTQLMIEYNLGVTVQDTFSIKRLDVDSFDPDA